MKPLGVNTGLKWAKAVLFLALSFVSAGHPRPQSVAASATVLPGQEKTEAGQAEKIPPRPEMLEFPPFEYEPPNPEDYRVPLEAGPVAYVVPDRELPLFNIVVYVRTGEYLEPDSKVGLSSLTGYLMPRGGTQTMSAQELEERLAFLAANLSGSIEDTHGSVSLNLLSKDLEEGLELLRDVLSAPRFQEDRLKLAKEQFIQAMKQRNDDSSSIESREAAFLATGKDFWANRHPTLPTIRAIERTDLLRFHEQWFHPSNFVVAVSGDFEREEMVPLLEELFSDWPYPPHTPPPMETNTHFASPGAYIVDKEVNQGRVTMMLPGIMRNNPDYFSVLVMNEILGGGGFTSRIMNRVRSEEGLAYSAGSVFPGGIYYPSAFRVAFQTKSRTVPYAISIVQDEIRRIATEPVSAHELNTAKQSFIDRFPRIFASKSATANIFAMEEFTGRYKEEPDFYKHYRSRFRQVTPEDVLKVGREYLNPDRLVVLIVGEKPQILLGHPDHPVLLAQIVKGDIRELPLRDPLTMEPLPRKPTPEGSSLVAP